jgi:hypothetical protein
MGFRREGPGSSSEERLGDCLFGGAGLEFLKKMDFGMGEGRVGVVEREV